MAAVSEDHVWIVAAALLAGASLVAYILRELVPPASRYFRAKRPLRVHFLAPSIDKVPEDSSREIDYLILDEKEHYLKELVVPSNRELYIQIMLQAKLAFNQHQIAVRFENPDGLKQPPLVDHYKLHFVRLGEREKFPGRDVGHWLDYHDVYHITEERPRTSGQEFTYGFIIKTREPGIFPFVVSILFDGTLARYKLDFSVHDRPKQKVRCALHFGCWVSPNVSNHRVDSPTIAPLLHPTENEAILV
jgi:hypothetical protein